MDSCTIEFELCFIIGSACDDNKDLSFAKDDEVSGLRLEVEARRLEVDQLNRQIDQLEVEAGRRKFEVEELRLEAAR